MQNQENNHKLCFFEATDQPSIIIEIIFTIPMLLISVITARQFISHLRIVKTRLASKYRTRFLIKSFEFQVFFMVGLWAAITLAKMLLNIFVYYSEMRGRMRPTDYGRFILYEAFFYLGDILSTFIVVSLLILIPYRVKTVMRTIQKGSSTISAGTANNELQREDLKQRKFIKNIYLCLKVSRAYIYLRLSLPAFYFLAFFLIIFKSEYFSQRPYLKNILTILDSLLIIAFYIFGFYVSEFLRKKQYIRMNPPEYQKLKIQYILLLSVLVIRCFLNALFYLINSTIYNNKQNVNDNCTLKTPNQMHSLLNCLYLGFGYCFMHVLPVLTVVYIYSTEKWTISRNQMAVLGEQTEKTEKFLNETKTEEDVIISSENRNDQGMKEVVLSEGERN